MVVQISLGVSNVFVIRAGRPILVDTGRPSDTARLVAGLAREGIKPADLALIILSHGHWDHAGGTAPLKALTAAPVAIHPGDAGLVRNGDNGSLVPLGPMGRLLGVFGLSRRGFPAFEPDLMLERGESLREFGLNAEVVSLPGHTKGSIGLFLESGDAFVGDIAMGGYAAGKVWPRRANLHYFAQDPRQLRQSLQVLAERKPRRLWVGHGGPIAGEEFSKRLPALLAGLPG